MTKLTDGSLLKIKIKKCSGKYFWYKNRIGEIFEVIEVKNGKFHINLSKFGNRKNIGWVEFNDAELID